MVFYKVQVKSQRKVSAGLGWGWGVGVSVREIGEESEEIEEERSSYTNTHMNMVQN